MHSPKLFVVCALFAVASGGAAAQTANLFSCDEATRNVGQTATVCGTIAQAATPASGGGNTFLNCDYRYPNHRFLFFITPLARPNYNPPADTTEGKCMCGVGLIETYTNRKLGRTYTEIKNPSQLYEARTAEEKAKCK